VASTDRIFDINPENRFFSNSSQSSYKSQRLTASTNSGSSGACTNLSTLTLEYTKEE
jgi:hypothetical protein